MARKTKQDEHGEDIAVLKVEMETVKKDLEQIKNSQEAMLLELTRYRGMWGAFVLIGTAVWACFVLFKDNIISLFSGTHGSGH